MNEMDQRPGGLAGSWTHSMEEDEGGVRVYRPTRSFAFPPTRSGRETLEFGDAGQVNTGMPGPDDRQRFTPSSLTALGMNRYRLGGAGQVIEVVEARPDVLKLRFV